MYISTLSLYILAPVDNMPFSLVIVIWLAVAAVAAIKYTGVLQVYRLQAAI